VKNPSRRGQYDRMCGRQIVYTKSSATGGMALPFDFNIAATYNSKYLALVPCTRSTGRGSDHAGVLLMLIEYRIFYERKDFPVICSLTFG